MYELVQKMKHDLYNKSPYKEELDTLYTNQQNMLRSVNGVGNTYFEYTRDRISYIEKEMNSNFERIIMGGDGSAANFDSETNIKVADEMLSTQISAGLDPLPSDEEMEKDRQARIEEEEQEFHDVEEHLVRSSKTLKLSRIAIKNLPKSISDKFVLPMDMGKEGDFDRFNELKQQPFSFLEYNGAKFSINLSANTDNAWDKMNDQLVWADIITERLREFGNISNDMERRKIHRVEKMKKLNKVDTKLEKHIVYLKEEFEKKSEKFGNDKYINFLGSRTVSNIKKIRDSQEVAKRKLNSLKNKRLYNDPKAFFKRMIKLYLGETGRDILKDLKALGYTGKKDAQMAIEYFLFLLNIVESSKEFTSPVLPLVSSKEFNVGFEEVDMMKVMCGHMFIHTITITKERKGGAGR